LEVILEKCNVVGTYKGDHLAQTWIFKLHNYLF